MGDVPQLVVIFMEKDDGAGGLDVKRTGSVEDRVFNQLDNTRVRNRRFFLGGDG